MRENSTKEPLRLPLLLPSRTRPGGSGRSGREGGRVPKVLDWVYIDRLPDRLDLGLFFAKLGVCAASGAQYYAKATVSTHVVVSVVDKRPCELALTTVLHTGTLPYECNTEQY
jgi:hypothetical protein